VKTQQATIKKIGNALNTDDDKGIVIGVAVALLIVSVVVGYYAFFRPLPEGYTTIDVLDSQGRASDYIDTLIVHENYSFNIEVVNHMGQPLSCQVQLKVTNETIPLFPAEINPISTSYMTVSNGETWEIQIPVALQETGSHAIIFELWTQNAAGKFEFSGNAVIRNVDAVQP